MAIFQIFLAGDRTPLEVELYYQRLDDVLEDASRRRFITGQLSVPDEQGVCRQVMIPTARIHCLIETE